MNFKDGTGAVHCRLCGASFQMPIHHLHEPIDIYSEWLDACDAAEKSGTSGNGGVPGGDRNELDNQDQRYFDQEASDDDIPESSGLERGGSSARNADTSNKNKSRGGATSNGASKNQSASTNYAALGLDDSDSD